MQKRVNGTIPVGGLQPACRAALDDPRPVG